MGFNSGFKELIGTDSHPNIQKIQIIGFSLKIGYIGRLMFSCYYLQCVPQSELLTTHDLQF